MKPRYRQKEILDIMGQPRTVRQLMDDTGHGYKLVIAAVMRLKARGLIQRTGGCHKRGYEWTAATPVVVDKAAMGVWGGLL